MADDISIKIGVQGGEDIAKVNARMESLDRNVKKITQSFDKGRLTNQAYFKGMNQQISAMTKLGVKYKDAQKYVWGLSKELRAADAAQEELIESTDRLAQAQTRAQSASAKFAQTSRKGMRNMEVVAQQAGYQIGDLAVQIQGGTNAAVAFGQQGSQLLGFFGPMGALAGAGLAITTAFVAPFIKAKEKAEDFYDYIEENLVKLELLRSGFEDKEALDKYKQIAVKEQEIANIRENYAGMTAAQQRSNIDLVEAMVKAKQDEISTIREELQYYTDIKMAIAAAESTAKLMTQSAEDSAQAKEDEAEFVESLVDLVERALKAEQDRLDTYNHTKDALTQQVLLAQAEAEHGKDSAEYREREKKSIIAAAQWAWKKSNLTVGERQVLLSLLEAQLKAEDSITENANQAERLADALKEAAKAMDDLSNFSAGIDRAIAVATARVDALRAGADASVAGTIAKYKSDLQAKIDAAIASGVSRGEVEAKFGGDRAKIAQLETILNTESGLRSTGSGGTKAETETASEYLARLQQEANFKQSLIGKTKEYITNAERRAEIEDQLEQLKGEYTEKDIERILRTEAATRKLAEAEQYRENMIQSFEDTLMQGMEALVTGSESVEDAFKGMLRNILLEIYRSKIMQPMATAGADLLWNLLMANGGAFNKGVQMFANGGVVNAPTMFGHSGGLGVMGEAGPEAIMPLKRGSDGKLGVAGGGNVTVNQTFQFTANGDESVKKIIAQAAPQIAKMTQSQIMDSRRRGGQMKATFS